MSPEPYPSSPVKRVLKQSDKPLSANQIADRLGIDWHTANEKLEELADSGDAHSKEMHNRLTLWWDREIPV